MTPAPDRPPVARVIEYSGCCYAHEPREFFIGDARHVVGKVLRSRLEQREGEARLTCSVWRVRDTGEEVFDLAYDWTCDTWHVEKVHGRRASLRSIIM